MQQGEQEGKTPEPIINDSLTRGSRIWHRVYQLMFALILSVVVINSVTDRTTAYLEHRNVAVSSSLPNAITTHTFTFDLVGIPFIGSLSFEYCSNSPLPDFPCTPPVGMDASGATITDQQGGVLGFTIHPNTALSPNRIVITRTPASVTVPGPVTYAFSNIKNPDGSTPTTFVRVAFYSSSDGTGAPGDTGSVAFSVQNPLTVTVYVPPYLALCTGVTVAVDCTSTNGSTVDLGELSKINPTTGTTQFAVATNSINGYTVSVQGSTMTAGNRVIASLPTPTSSQGGVSQFGINLRSNSSPSVGQDVVGLGSGGVKTSYNTPNQFMFSNGDILASSTLPTDWNRYTISYLVNVADSQKAGRYAATMTVIATTTF